MGTVLGSAVGSIYSSTRRILRHPANRGRRGRALTLYVTWQVWERLVGRPWTIRLGTARLIRLYPHATVAALVLYCRIPDYEELSFIEDYLESGDLFVDVGANVGVYSLWASQTDGVDVLAFEPSSLTCNRILENVRLNGLEDRVIVRRQAVGAKRALVRLTTGLDAVNQLVVDGTASAVLASEVVEQTTLDDALDARAPALIKIDVEGAELEVLRGGRGAILGHRPALLVEVNDPEGLATLLDELGYRCWKYDPGDHTLVPTSPVARSNVLALADPDTALARILRKRVKRQRGETPGLGNRSASRAELPWPMSHELDRARQVLRHRGLRAVSLGLVGEMHARLEFSRQRQRGPQTFVVDGVEHTELLHLHNRTWRNERAVEVPLAMAFLERQGGPVLELGNVLVNYGQSGHVVVDKYEQGPGVLNVDIVDFKSTERFGAIVAISTLEHVGWDEEPRDAAKISQAVRHLRRLLLPTGRLFVTCPLSYNPNLDSLISNNGLEATNQAFLVRDGRLWSQTDGAAALARARMGPYGGNAIWIAELQP